MKRVIRAGVRVIARKDAPSMAKVFAKARGLKSLPPCPWRVKTGKKATVMTIRAKKRDGPTSFAASMMILVRSSAFSFVGSLPSPSPLPCILLLQASYVHSRP